MKKVLLALITLTATSAFAGPHCPPGQDNVWGACINRGSGVLNPVVDPIYRSHRPMKRVKKGCATRRAQYPTVRQYPDAYNNGSHCPPWQVNVWGACVDRTNSGWGW